MITEGPIEHHHIPEFAAAHAGAAVERYGHTCLVVFLAGERAWKLKRAVRYDYLDYSTATNGASLCEAEVRINRRTAPSLYSWRHRHHTKRRRNVDDRWRGMRSTGSSRWRASIRTAS
jgi:aminoglycoside phosphotransferase family enzyme